MRKKNNLIILLLSIFALLSIITAFFSFINYKNATQAEPHYNIYIGKIESMEQDNGTKIVEVSPARSNRFFISEISANHQIKFNIDDISVRGVADPNKKHMKLK